MNYQNLRHKTVLMIVNKDASLKAVSKEIMKLNAVVADVRTSCASWQSTSKEVGQAIEQKLGVTGKVINTAIGTLANMSGMAEKVRVANEALTRDYSEWSFTGPKDILTKEGQQIDECTALDQYNTMYLEVNEAQMQNLIKKCEELVGSSVDDSKSVHFLKNVVFTKPIVPFNNLYEKILSWIKTQE